LLPEGSDTFAYVEALRAVNEDLFYPFPGSPSGRVKATNEIAYADDSGVMQFLRRSLLSGAYKFGTRSHQVLPKSMLRHFQANLNFVTNLICIGYGLGDLHINAIIREWLEFTSDRQLEIVNPLIEGVPPFLLHLSPQVTLTKSDTTEFLDQRSGIKRSSLDKLKKQLATTLRRRGKQRAAQNIDDFRNMNQKRIAEFISQKVSELPHVNGRPDLAGLGDLGKLGKRWAAEAGIEEELLLSVLLEHLAKD
jgi:hypothetical protein